ncbi:MAG: thioredoxin domain-containing protein, partial [Chitinophagaceae bacterium]|nr:thioredoxin domain-containing protein [Chitinophagaceae bacterium]
MKNYTNHLIKETSPYLLQHAHNPVDWYPWNEEALQKSKDNDKPILVSIGYSACHWCHVMEKESFENEDTAKLMNEFFINIKIDREERPDLDHIYMDAVQAMAGNGGWPLNVFLTPDCKPFYGGTYFPPVNAFNRPSWKEVLTGVHRLFIEKRQEVEAQAEELTRHIGKTNEPTQNLFTIKADEQIFTWQQAKTIFENIMKQADKKWGGFGNAPKFPQSFTIKYLLRYYHYTKNEEALTQACLSLDKMIYGGIYDQIGGGFARYSTDEEWLAPHFEKMLYDNALLISVLCDAYQLTGNQLYKVTVDQTIDFIQRELMNEDNGFYSALDADSEGKEGKFYVWSFEEIQEILGEDAKLFCEYYDVSPQGNWEHTNILRVLVPLSDFARKKNIDEGELEKLLKQFSSKLFQQRSRRVRPQTDDKILLGWNALMNIALSRASAAFVNDTYKALAIANFNFLWSKFQSNSENVILCHTYKNGIAKYPAFLDDYAYLIKACINLQEITSNVIYLEHALSLTKIVIENFSHEANDHFYYTGKSQTDIIVRKKEIYDGAIPSGNSVMAANLLYLSIIFDNKEWKEKAITLVKNLLEIIIKYPTSFG